MTHPTANTEHTVEVRHTFQASPERLFQVWTTPAELIACFKLKRAEVDLRPGGAYTWVFRNPDGSDDPATGIFHKIDPPHRLVFTWIAACPAGNTGETQVTVTFRRIDEEQTEVIVRHERLPDEAVANDHRGGWRSCLAEIEAHLAAAP